MTTLPRASRALPKALICAIVLALGGAPPALAGPWWQIDSETSPTNLSPGGTGQLLIGVSDLGDEPIDGGKEPVTITDKLPPGLTATEIKGQTLNGKGMECSLATLRCTFKGVVNPYEQTGISIKVAVGVIPPSTLTDEASVEGGGATKFNKILSLSVSEELARFGVAGFEQASFTDNGLPATQAGSHPFELTTNLVLNQTHEREPVELPKDLSFHLPPGLVGNPNAASQCTLANFFAAVSEANLCSASSAVGVATVTVNEPLIANVVTKTVPVFNLVPSQGEPARLGFEVIGKIPIVIDTSVRSGSDYGVNAVVNDATETAGVLSSQVTIWGVPEDPRHNASRGWECVAGEAFAGEVKKSCPTTSETSEEPFLTSPTSCETDPDTEPVITTMTADSWAHPGILLGAEYAWMNQAGERIGFGGCGELPFEPSIKVVPEEDVAATPTGVDVGVTVPQSTTLEAGKLAEADVRDSTVTLPAGMELSPAAATGLESCSEDQVGFTGFNQASETDEFDTSPSGCPDGSKVGTVKIETPLLSHELEGSVFLASPAPNGEVGRNPFNSLVALYIVAEDPVSGVLVKLAGEGHVDEGTLQVSTTFRNTPQVPFEELKLHLFGGPRASLSTPERCGGYATSGVFTPWSGTPAVSAESEFGILAGAGGSGCPAAGGLPFGPGFVAGSNDSQAGAFTSFSLELSRPDGDQALSAVSMHLPSGIAALLSSVELCSQAQAATDTCPAGSEVGHAIAFAGLGAEPYEQAGGRVYITGPYDGAPFGLAIVTPAQAGPFDLGYITVRSRLYVNENDASVTIDSDPLPTQIRGIPLQLKRVIVNVDRPNFEFNPTSCNPTAIDGTVTGAEGASASVSSAFKAEGCQNLPFDPRLTAAAIGHGSKASGTTFAVTVTSGGVGANGVAQAGIAKVNLQLPKQLSSRLPTLQKACLASVFEANPASCAEGSIIGNATIHTPVLRNPLSGPAYLVSHGNAGFPDVEFVLQGENIKLVLDGKTDIKNGITYSRFESTPDAPFTTFETVLPAGPHGILTPNVAESKHFNLCGETLTMPTTIIAQNGAKLEHHTPITIQGCTQVKSAHVKKLTRAQLLAKALKTCRHKYKHSKRKRQQCERKARKHYAPKKRRATHHTPAKRNTGKKG